MKKLNQLIECDYEIEISGIATDSRNVKNGYLFIATKGFHVDHFDFVEDAIEKGAIAVITDRLCKFSVPTIVVSNIDEVLLAICEKFYNVSSQDFHFIGITGTDGKTTTATITRNLLNTYVPTAYIGTNGLFCGDDIYPTSNTTPCIEELYYYFSIIKEHKCKIVVMEVSSEALLHHRVDSILFDAIGYTNITEDHLNVHKTLENYRNCKFRLANLCCDDAPIFINGDDENCLLLDNDNIVKFGVNKENDCVISGVKNCKDNTKFTLYYQQRSYIVNSPFSGLYNVYNVVLAWLLACSLLNFDSNLIDDISNLPLVLGRRELFLDQRGFSVLLDYAHTENGILNLLQSLSDYSRVIVVTGAAGGREVEKRPKIGKILFRFADYVIFTADDPRYEEPKNIAIDMLGDYSGNNYTFISSRQEAIKYAFQKAQKGDVIAIIGKRRDNYMAILDKRIPYSDYDEIMKHLVK